jgi:hypothetical protein
LGSSAVFHANQFGLQVRCEMQQLLARKLLAHNTIAAQVSPKQMKDGLAELNAIVCRSMGHLLCFTVIP